MTQTPLLFIFSLKGKRENGSWYRGGKDPAGKRHGIGRKDYDNGRYTIGEYDHGIRCGHWIIYKKDGSINFEKDY